MLLQEVGLYEYSHPLDTSDQYKAMLDEVEAACKQRIKDGSAVTSTKKWAINGSARRVNMVNARREFFYATPQEVREALHRLRGSVLQYVETPEALEWRQSENVRHGLPLTLDIGSPAEELDDNDDDDDDDGGAS